MNLIKKIIITLITLLPLSLYSQIDTAKTFTTGEFRLLLNENKKDVLYEFADTLNKVFITTDSIKINSSSYRFSQAIKNLKEIGYPKQGTFIGGFWRGALIGFGIGFIFGGFVHIDFGGGTGDGKWHSEMGAVIGGLLAIPFSLVGAVISIGAETIDYIKIEGSSSVMRLKLIKAIREGKK